ncbi:MAG: SGNH/GDSL hydrolase family protein, partial [Candidatus Omnitrophica bacterium]|nr:SGNH/GDSL hydrolase family protein [Candidatus Omnitrophota bacterium]
EIDNQLWMGVLGDKINLSNAYMRSEMERFNNGLRNLAKQENFELIDLERLVPKDLKHFYDDVHYTPEGSKLVAEIISQYLITTEPLH